MGVEVGGGGEVEVGREGRDGEVGKGVGGEELEGSGKDSVGR